MVLGEEGREVDGAGGKGKGGRWSWWKREGR